jgi:hypothetical protein
MEWTVLLWGGFKVAFGILLLRWLFLYTLKIAHTLLGGSDIDEDEN